MAFGKQMAWGVAGGGLASFLGGYLIGELSEDDFSGPDYSPLFYLSIGILIFDILILMTLIKVPESEILQNDCNNNDNRIRKSLSLLKNPEIVVFGVWCVVSGCSKSIIGDFELWLQDDLMVAWTGCSDIFQVKLLQGLSLLIQAVLGEMPYNFFSGQYLLSKRWKPSILTLAM